MIAELFPRRSLLGKRQWYFRIKARNGETLAQSEGYANRVDALHTLQLLRDGAHKIVIKELPNG